MLSQADTNITETYSINVPTVVGLSKNKNWILNLNNYRNAHYLTLNKAKVNFKHLVSKEISKLPVFKRIDSIEYILYRDTHRLCDVANVCSIVDKFFCDALVEAQKLPDDNYKYLKTISYQWGGIADSAYVTIKITGLTQMKLNLNLTLEQQDIIEAVKAYAIKLYPQYEKSISATTVELIPSDKGVVTCELSFGNIKGSEFTSNSSSTIGDRSSGSRDVSNNKSEPATKEEPETTTEKIETKPEKREEEKKDSEPRKNIFAKRASAISSADRVESTEPDNPDHSYPSDNVELETPASIGASIFGRKKV